MKRKSSPFVPLRLFSFSSYRFFLWTETQILISLDACQSAMLLPFRRNMTRDLSVRLSLALGIMTEDASDKRGVTADRQTSRQADEQTNERIRMD